jgi:hypothetical protein
MTWLGFSGIYGSGVEKLVTVRPGSLASCMTRQLRVSFGAVV